PSDPGRSPDRNGRRVALAGAARTRGGKPWLRGKVLSRLLPRPRAARRSVARRLHLLGLCALQAHRRTARPTLRDRSPARLAPALAACASTGSARALHDRRCNFSKPEPSPKTFCATKDSDPNRFTRTGS